MHQSVQDYIAAIPQEEVEKRANALLCWEMDNHDKFAVANGKVSFSSLKTLHWLRENLLKVIKTAKSQ